MPEIFHINERILDLNGFTKHVWGDKNSPNDTLNTLKFEEFSKYIKADLLVQVCYVYTTIDGKEFMMCSSSISIVVEEYSVELPIKDLSDFLTLIRILKGDD